jgi:hypothetical protein
MAFGDRCSRSRLWVQELLVNLARDKLARRVDLLVTDGEVLYGV